MKNMYKTSILILLIMISGCKKSENTAKIETDTTEDQRIEIAKAQFQQNNMVMGNIETKPFPVSIKVNGVIDVPPENKAIVNAIIGGYVKTIPLLVGDMVKKGQVLVSLENPEFVALQQNYLEVKEQLNYLKTEFERQRTMFEENIISKKVFLKSESAYKTANARYKGLKKQLLLLNIDPLRAEQGNFTSVVNIYAPINGSITKVHVSKGSYVSPTTAILEIVDNSHIHLELSVFEKDIMNIKKAQNILFKIPEASNDFYEASVYLVGSSIEDNRTIKVHAHPKNESHQFLTGMFVNAEIITEERTANALPETAVIEVDGNYFILVLDEQTDGSYFFNQVKIDVGRTYNGYVELKNSEALPNNNKLLTRGGFSLIN